ncbi:response regulator [Rhodospirillum centenum]|uniref:histidine kinase n=1 Tax=Rhodospirillum centenum (strain ATCC 51521 / SW) TaxID=414684 RepID=B6IMX1_RHOCS|nr:response regulator [Rhodospirillum centenum]ACI98868.1 sensor histidine kinase [Rhodospirillum centenum SW]
MSPAPIVTASVQLDQLRLYAETHRSDAYLESVIVGLVAVAMASWVPWERPALWTALYVPMLAVTQLRLRSFLSSRCRTEAITTSFREIAALRAVLTLLWASIPFWSWVPGDLLNNGIIMLLLAGSMGATSAMSTADGRLYLIDTLPVAAAFVAAPLLDPNGFGLTLPALCVAFVSYLFFPAIATYRNMTKLIRLRHEKDALIAELAAARDAAQAANAAKTEFLANMSHELRTPLNGMLGVVQLMRARTLPQRDLHLVDVLHDAGRGLLAIVNDLLDLSNIEGGRFRIRRRPFCPRVLAETVADMLLPSGTAKGVSITCDVAPDLPQRLVGDEARLRQVLLNLMGNALKFTDRGHVALTIGFEPGPDPGQGTLLLRVEDSGIGITPERLAQIEGGTVRPDPRRGGAGLGLAITRGVLSAMEGHLEIDSTPGRGTCIRVQVPATVAHGTAPVPPPPSPGSACALRVLIVEDVEVNRLILEQMLERLGHRTLCTDSGEAALEIVRREPVDLILMDIRLQGMDGAETTRRLRALPDNRLASLPVVAVTANVFPEDEAAYRQAGMSAVIAKPIQFDRLRDLMDVMAARRLETADRP